MINTQNAFSISNPAIVKKSAKLDACLRVKDEAKLANSPSILQKSSELLEKSLNKKASAIAKLKALKEFEKDLGNAKLTKAEMKRLVLSCTDEFIDLQVTQRDHAIKVLRTSLSAMSKMMNREAKLNASKKTSK